MALAVLCCFLRSLFPMKVWCLGCWPLLQGSPNTRWTWGWPEICSWQPRSASRTDLLEMAFPLYLRDGVHMIQSGFPPPHYNGAYLTEIYLGVASVCRLVWPPNCVCVMVQEKSERGSCSLTAAPDCGNSSCKERTEDLWRSVNTETESTTIFMMINKFSVLLFF